MFKRKKKQGFGLNIDDHKSPLRAAEQNAPEPERPTRVDEEAGQSIPELRDPPQAEGRRE